MFHRFFSGFNGAPELLAATGQGEVKKEIDALSEAGTILSVCSILHNIIESAEACRIICE